MTIRYSNMLLATASVTALAVAGAAHAQTAPPAAPLPEAAAAQPDSGAVSAVVVTGSRLTAGFQAPTPVTVVGQAQLQERAPTSVIDVVNELPAFRNTTSPSNTTFGIRTAGQANVDLRGLGVTRTLVLINGERHVPVTSAAAVDTNQIPTALVDRIEVVTGGASAAYGSDAVAGVVNFVLKTRMDGFTGNVLYGTSQRDDNIDRQLSGAFGKSFADGKAHFIIGGDYATNSGVGSILNKRDWGAKEPGILTLAAGRAPGLPANIVSNYVESSASCDGGYITNTVLKGTCFDANGNPFNLAAQEVATGALVGPSLMISPQQINRGANLYPTQVIKGAYKRSAVLGRFEYDLDSDTTLYAQGSFSSLRDNTIGNTTNPIITIMRNNPFLPAATLNAMIANNLQSFTMVIQGGPGNLIHPAYAHNPVDTWEGQAGIKGKVFGNWNWDFAFVHGETHSIRTADYYWNQGNWYESLYAVPGANGQAVCGPVATNPNFAQFDPVVATYVQPGCVPWNPFGGSKTDPAAVAYSFAASSSDEHQKQDSASLNLSGEPFMLPAGPVSLAVGAEWRNTNFNAMAGYNSAPFYLVNENNVSFSGAVSVKEAYGEVGIPVVKDAPLFKSLDLNAAIRRTDYSTSGAVTTWKIGGTWDVNDLLRLRATRSRDIRAPNISELFSLGTQGRGNVTNPITGFTAVAYGYSVGNTALQPEVADTTTAGVVLQPEGGFARGFRASVDYYNIKIAGVIATVAAQDVINRCLLQNIQSYCTQIDFSTTNPLGFTATHSKNQNQNQLYADGFDFEASYRVPIEALNLPGNFNVRILGNRAIHLTTTANNIPQDAAGQLVPKWTWTGDFDYQINRLSIGLQARYKSPVKYSLTLTGPDSPNYNPASATSINRNIWPGLVYFSTNLSYDLITSGGKRVQIYGIIDNLMDKSPPIIALSLQSGGNPYDLIGRNFKVGLRFNF